MLSIQRKQLKKGVIMTWWAILLIVLGGLIGLIGIVILGFIAYLAITADSRT